MLKNLPTPEIHCHHEHVGAVSEAARRCKLSELMQAELDTRYVRKIQTFKAAKSALAVAELWINS